ncbi:MAG: CRISPR-associated RAMP protein [Blastocatellia bacterium AA13]|nr:MAG: CRISPR-associated RAMP protein [Blastocatellia bacterium AA13]
MFSRFTSRININGDLIAETGLHIGAGASSLDPAATDSRVIQDAGGRPFVPGSSFKGALRGHLESIIRALGRSEPWTCDPLANPCIPAKRQKGGVTMEDIQQLAEDGSQEDGRTNYAEYDKRLTEGIVANSCSVCRLLGSPWLASRVLIKDLFIDEESWAGRLELRDGVGIDRDTGAARQGIKYDFEVVPARAQFGLEMTVENADACSFGLLAIALRELERGAISVGGKTTRGLGAVKLKLSHIDVVGELAGDPQYALASYLISGSAKKMTGEPMQQFMTTSIEKLLNGR